MYTIQIEDGREQPLMLSILKLILLLITSYIYNSDFLKHFFLSIIKNILFLGDSSLHIAMRARSKAIVGVLLKNPKHSQLLYKPNR